MNVGDYIDLSKKKPWRRRVYDESSTGGGHTYRNMTQDDFLDEVNSAAHDINSPRLARRPIYGPTGEKDKNGKAKWAIVGYDTIETVPVGKQQEIISKKISHFAANGFWSSSESKGEDYEERFSTLQSWMDIAGLKTAFLEVITSTFRTGDGAIYLYQADDEDDPIKYEVYGYEEGSVLFPRTKFDGTKSLARKYCFDGHSAVDIFTPQTRETWMMLDEKDDDYRTFVREGETPEKSEDGYTLVRRQDAQAGSRLCQCIYFRVSDIPTGVAQLSIEKLEGAKTYVGEHLKGSTMPVMFVKAEKLSSLPPSNIANRTIGAKGTADSLAHADAKFLAPPDASNIADLHIGGLESDIRDTCLSVKIDPEIIKQGSDSSATMKILYAPEIQWAQIHWPEIYKSTKELMLVFKALVGKVEQDVEGYDNLRVSVGQNIFIPQNEKEMLEMETDAVYARIKSRKAAMVDSGNTHRNDWEQTNKEWRDEITMKAEIPAEMEAKYGTRGKTVADDDNPNTPKVSVTNQAKGKTISEGLN